MVGLGRFELPTSPLSGVRSNQLSYRPKLGLALLGDSSASRLRVWQTRLLRNPSSSKKVSRTRLNVLPGYARDDHRGMYAVREGLIRLSLRTTLVELAR